MGNVGLARGKRRRPARSAPCCRAHHRARSKDRSASRRLTAHQPAARARLARAMEKRCVLRDAALLAAPQDEGDFHMGINAFLILRKPRQRLSRRTHYRESKNSSLPSSAPQENGNREEAQPVVQISAYTCVSAWPPG